MRHNIYFPLVPFIHQTSYRLCPLTSAKSCSEAFRHARTAWWRHKRLVTETHCAERKKFDITSAAVAGLSAPLSLYEMQSTEEHVGSL